MIPVTMMTQPNDETCGPPSLHAVYHYYGDPLSLETVIQEVQYLETGGTLAVFLACHALRRGYRAKIYTYNLKLFDPTWFKEPPAVIIEKLRRQQECKKSKKIQDSTGPYIEFLTLGGELFSQELNPALLKGYFNRGVPVLTGLNATYLYQCKREYAAKNNKAVSDDIRGFPMGHFVVLCGYDDEKRHVIVADPFKKNPMSKNNYYSVDAGRLINAILLGIVTYDANLLVVEKGMR